MTCGHVIEIMFSFFSWLTWSLPRIVDALFRIGQVLIFLNFVLYFISTELKNFKIKNWNPAPPTSCPAEWRMFPSRHLAERDVGGVGFCFLVLKVLFKRDRVRVMFKKSNFGPVQIKCPSPAWLKFFIFHWFYKVRSNGLVSIFTLNFAENVIQKILILGWCGRGSLLKSCIKFDQKTVATKFWKPKIGGRNTGHEGSKWNWENSFFGRSFCKGKTNGFEHFWKSTKIEI